jgi:signal transduction histidine kinase
MDEEAGCLEKIIEDLLDLARMEIGWIKIKKEKGQLAETLRSVARNFQGEAQKKQLLYHVNIPDEMAPVYFDKENISRVVSRLLGNALKYTEHGEISLEAEEDADKVKVSISDTGKVIEEKELVNIFNLFCDGDGKYEGIRKMNIKLPVIKHIVEAHGGTIWAMSQETQGTRITFTIPKEACRDGSDSEI